MSTLFCGLAIALAGAAPIDPRDALTADLAGSYAAWSDITYRKASGAELKLDVYAPEKPARPTPTVIYFHGGGWVAGSKNIQTFNLLPYLALGFQVVNAEQYKFDTERLIATGHSAGGRLALMTGLLSPGGR